MEICFGDFDTTFYSTRNLIVDENTIKEDEFINKLVVKKINDEMGPGACSQ